MRLSNGELNRRRIIIPVGMRIFEIKFIGPDDRGALASRSSYFSAVIIHVELLLLL